MDSITHLALGAVIGDAMLGKSLGKKAMLIGAVAQFCPDSDVVASLWLSTVDNFLVHRGITHSLLFVGLAALLFSLAASRLERNQYGVTLSQWIIFFSTQLFIHISLDAFNAYGVGWFEPFSNQRISFNTLFVADPFFSIWIFTACIVLLILKYNHPHRTRWISFALILSSGYMTYCVFNKLTIHRDVKNFLQDNHVSYQRYFTTPTPFNSWLWYVVIENESGYEVGYRSVFDQQPNLSLTYFPKQDSLLLLVTNQETVKQLRTFSQGYYTIEYKDTHLIFNDLRFGQQAGWHDAKAPFVFSHNLQHVEKNLMGIQRGRLAGWDKESFLSFVNRIKGN